MSPRRSVAAASELVELAALPPVVVEPTATDKRQERELEDLIAEIGTDGKIHVHNDGRFAGVMSLDGFSLEVLLDQYGGGDKTLTIYQGSKKRDTVRVALDPDIPATSPRARKLQEAAAKAAAPAGGPSNQIESFMMLMLKTQMDGAKNMQDMMTGMVTAMTAVLNATANRQPAADPLDAALKVAGVLKEGRGDGAPSFADLLTIFEKGIGMGKQITGGSDDDGTTALIGKGLEVLQGVATAANTNAEARAAEARAAALSAVRPVPAIPAEVASTSQAGEPRADTGRAVAVVGTDARDNSSGASAHRIAADSATDGARPWIKAAGQSMSMLQSAAAWMTPARAADAIADRLDDEAYQDLVADMDTPGFGERLAGRYPEVRAVPREWLGSLIKELLGEGDGPRTDEAEVPGFVEDGDANDDGPPAS